VLRAHGPEVARDGGDREVDGHGCDGAGGAPSSSKARSSA
jgi:hypothetical protein